MQYKTFVSAAQSVEAPIALDITLFEQSVRSRIEAFALNADALIEHCQQPGLPNVAQHLEQRLLEIRFLLNDLSFLHAHQA
ncbi:hypothetical protein [Microscilla marina]|uniref:Uncharacterized protein n=1 Tax=Microscilla marina ATCC 23134 TaxID=313606 RepID=A1ZN64_MICM2|nr:hypothetical protein [Microscilla marina]EAY28245.1 hypothetical protein M23134_03506 [Microscilla marina ATCC 23134]